MDSIDRSSDAEYRLAKALAENSKLLAENQRLRKLLDIKSRIPGIALGSEIRQPPVLDTKSTTAFGKTVVAAWLIAARKVNTLILVHRRQLLDQWRECLALFFDLPKKGIGQIGGGSRKPSGRIDVAVIQSLNRKHIVDDIVEKYGHIVVDECHHLSAFSFEQVLRGAKARYVLGLTATPIRKDGHHPIIIMQCGPVRYRVNPRIQARNRPFGHFVVPRFTGFCLSLQTREPEINEIYSAGVMPF